MSALLTACAVSGFYASVGHCFYVQIPGGIEACELERPRFEADMRAHGQVIRFTTCRHTATFQARAHDHNR